MSVVPIIRAEERRVPPHDAPCEAAVISAIVRGFQDASVDPKRPAEVDKALRALSAGHFYLGDHRHIFEALAALHARGGPLDVPALVGELSDRNRLAQVGGEIAVVRLVDSAPAVARLDKHVQRLEAKRRARQLLATAQRAEARAYLDAPAEEIASELREVVDAHVGGDSSWSDRLAPVEDEWLTAAPPKRTWLLRDLRRQHADGVLPLGKVGLLIGEGGVSKTMAACQLAIAVATGAPWLESFSVAQQGRVLMVLGEEEHEEVRRRLYHAARSMNAPRPAPGSIVTLPLAGVPCSLIDKDGDANLKDSAFAIWLRAYLGASAGWSLVLLDPLSRFAGPDAEKDNAAATRFVTSLESLAPASGGATVIATHHTNKTSRVQGADVDSASSRGSSGIVDGVRWVASLRGERIKVDSQDAQERLGEVVTLSFTKSNYSRKGDPLLLRRDGEHGGALIPLDHGDQELLAEARSGVRKRPAAEIVAAAHRAREQEWEAKCRVILELIKACPGGVGTNELFERGPMRKKATLVEVLRSLEAAHKVTNDGSGKSGSKAIWRAI